MKMEKGNIGGVRGVFSLGETPTVGTERVLQA